MPQESEQFEFASEAGDSESDVSLHVKTLLPVKFSTMDSLFERYVTDLLNPELTGNLQFMQYMMLEILNSNNPAVGHDFPTYNLLIRNRIGRDISFIPLLVSTLVSSADKEVGQG